MANFLKLFLYNIFFDFHKRYFLVLIRSSVLLSQEFGIAVMLKSLFTPLFGMPGIFSRINGFLIRFVTIFLGFLLILTFLVIGIGLYIYILYGIVFITLNHFILFILFVFWLICFNFYLYWSKPIKRIVDYTDLSEYFGAGDFESRKLLMNLIGGSETLAIKNIESSNMAWEFISRSEMNSHAIISFINDSRNSYNHIEFRKNLVDIVSKYKYKYLSIKILIGAYLLSKSGFIDFLRSQNLTINSFLNSISFQIFLIRKPRAIWEDDFIIPPSGGIDKGWAVGYTSNLNTFGQDYTKLALKGGMPQLYARETVKAQVIDILSKPVKSNVLIIGAPGTGKTTFVKGLAREIALGTKISALRFKRIISLNIGDILSGTRGEINKRMTDIMRECESSGNIILFIDEIHNIDAEIFSVIEPYLATGKFQFIGTTSEQNYAKFIRTKDAFAKAFDLVTLPETNDEETSIILQDLIKNLESQYSYPSVTYPAIEEIIDLARKYVHNRAFPDKAASLIVQAYTRCRNQGEQYLTRDFIINLISEILNLPIKKLNEDEKKVLLNIDSILSERLIGQPMAIAAISKSLKRARTGIRNDKKPMASFLFAGPTGVGKTEAAKVLADLYFGSENSMIRFDMSEFQSKDSLDRLIGNLSGEVGQLIYQIQAKPYSLILFDEIEKANPSILNIFLQILDEGFLTSANGDKTYFDNTFIIMTSNAGSNSLMKSLEKAKGTGKELDLSSVLVNLLKDHFKLEFLNRFTGIVPFVQLVPSDVKKIARIKLNLLSEKMENTSQIKISFADVVVNEISLLSYTDQWGARSINRVIEDKIETLLAEKLLLGELVIGGEYILENLDGTIRKV